MLVILRIQDDEINCVLTIKLRNLLTYRVFKACPKNRYHAGKWLMGSDKGLLIMGQIGNRLARYLAPSTTILHVFLLFWGLLWFFYFYFLKLSLCVVLVISAKGRLQLGTNRGRIIRLLSNDLTQTFHATSVWYALPPVTTGFLHPQVDGRPTDWGNINIASCGTGS